MPLKALVKINEVNNLTDARYVAGMGVDMIGFNIDKKSPLFVGPQKFDEIISWISGVQIIGEIDAFEEIELLETIEIFKVDMIQTTSIDTFKYLKKHRIPAVFKAFIYEYEKLEFLKLDAMHPEFVLLENHVETISEMESNQIKHLCREFNVLLSFGINSDNVLNLLQTYDLAGFGLFGGDEIRPGYREFDELADVLEKLEVDF